MEACGHYPWFERLLAELGVELWLGDAAKIRASVVRRQKSDGREAEMPAVNWKVEEEGKQRPATIRLRTHPGVGSGDGTGHGAERWDPRSASRRAAKWGATSG